MTVFGDGVFTEALKMMPFGVALIRYNQCPYLKGGLGAGEMTLWVRELPNNNKDGVGSQNTHTKLGIGDTSVTPALRGSRDRRIIGAC